ncbi:MAG TPA: hypothetical protein PLB96_06665 [Syntrophales bacterium]|nr:hypothetical protein [Syntrophales bacterium]HOI16487.1 hypothetical protein [Geobacteraceae bacterium]
MVRSKYTFEKRQRENAKRNKKMEKLAQRTAARNAKTVSAGQTTETDEIVADSMIASARSTEDTKNHMERG